MVRITAGFENTDKVEVTLTIRMELGEWKQLRASLGSQYPDWKLAEGITSAIGALEGRVSAAVEGQ